MAESKDDRDRDVQAGFVGDNPVRMDGVGELRDRVRRCVFQPAAYQRRSRTDADPPLECHRCGASSPPLRIVYLTARLTLRPSCRRPTRVSDLHARRMRTPRPARELREPLCRRCAAAVCVRMAIRLSRSAPLRGHPSARVVVHLATGSVRSLAALLSRST